MAKVGSRKHASRSEQYDAIRQRARSERTPGALSQRRAVMKTLTILCNVALAAMSALEVVTEGLPAQPPQWALAALIVLVPVFTVFVITRKPGRGGGSLPGLAVLCNLVLLGVTCWAAVAQYPYPEGPGIVPFVALAILTPVLSLAALRRAVRPSRTAA
jgi:cytochrome bd-type quinol oxidase subunit 2